MVLIVRKMCISCEGVISKPHESECRESSWTYEKPWTSSVCCLNPLLSPSLWVCVFDRQLTGSANITGVYDNQLYNHQRDVWIVWFRRGSRSCTNSACSLQFVIEHYETEQVAHLHIMLSNVLIGYWWTIKALTRQLMFSFFSYLNSISLEIIQLKIQFMQIFALKWLWGQSIGSGLQQLPAWGFVQTDVIFFFI